ncbi:hypothetical protein [Methylobacterium radiodurans]|uniref:Lysozyme inhibitor LprI N-terminal domain-containing protein n=1 Tax=Methylobacterium radiodurans TaxID=2202828 RepID=A0A2U8VWZ4_9HYPH|nr:hypothetical protein [Methylobacterium radiodurans]AWN37998.1 hypothetical protein DK427_21545 [Methylobacterium radiodurans]
MRRPVLRLVLALAGALAAGPSLGLGTGPTRPQGEIERLEQAWHQCLREASGHQPPGQSRAGDQRNALDACREREDAVVAALMAARGGTQAERSLGARARSWAASVAAYVLDPVSSWLGILGR